MPTNRTTGEMVLLFDGDCGFCTRTAQWTRRRVQPRCQVQPWQFAPSELTDPLLDLLAESIVVLNGNVVLNSDTKDAVLSRAAAAAAVLISSPHRGWRMLGRAIQLPGLRRIADLVYRLIAANRYRLPGSTPACAVRRP